MLEGQPDGPRADGDAARLEASVAQAIRDCGGDPVAAVGALILLNNAMRKDLAALRREVAELTSRISRAYARDLFYKQPGER